jgi:hypothetical protein
VKSSIFFILALVLLPASLAAQQRGRALSQGGRQGAPPRAALERQIISTFVARTGEEMALAPEGRQQLERILQDSHARRRQLGMDAAELRRRLAAAVRDPGTADTQFAALLREADELRRREHALWERDQQEISSALTPRQQAIFVLRWVRLQERIQQLIAARAGSLADTTR